MTQNKQLAVFRVKVGDILGNYSDRMKILVAENSALGMSADVIKAMRTNPHSAFVTEREKATKLVKREVAGLINRIFQAAYRGRVL